MIVTASAMTKMMAEVILENNVPVIFVLTRVLFPRGLDNKYRVCRCGEWSNNSSRSTCTKKVIAILDIYSI